MTRERKKATTTTIGEVRRKERDFKSSAMTAEQQRQQSKAKETHTHILPTYTHTHTSSNKAGQGTTAYIALNSRVGIGTKKV